MTVNLTSETAYDYVEGYYAKCELPDDCGLSITFRGHNDAYPVPVLALQATYKDARGVTCIDLWDVWVEGDRIYGEC